jgi:OmpA-OmpF porin, OOP family
MKKTLAISSLCLALSSQAQFSLTTDPIKLPGTVNTVDYESHPIITKDSSTMYFTRVIISTTGKLKYDQEIWCAKKDISGGFVNAEKINKVNNLLNNSIFGVSKDGNTLYLFDSYITDKKTKYRNGFATCTKKGDTWGEIQHVDITNLNIVSEHYDLHISNDENVMLISNQGPGSLGEEDLYVSLKKNNIWSEPIHMGNTINSAKYDISPFLSQNMDTLYFSSTGFGGQGDADIFYSVRKDATWRNWSTPQNLGNKINTPNFDAYFIKQGDNFYWSSNNDITNKDEIFTAKIIKPLIAKVDKTTNCSAFEVKDGQIAISVSGGLAPYTYAWSNGTNIEDLAGLPIGDYTVMITDAAGQKAELKGSITQPAKPLVLTTGLDLGKMLTPGVIIYFNVGSWEILPESAKELDRVVAVMNENPNLVIELGSHTDCRSSAVFNMKLSNNRASSSAAYIKARITNPNRIQGKGYGESRLTVNCPCEGPKKSNCPEDEHRKNRRTEFIIKSNDSKTIPKVDKVTPKIVKMK